MKVDSKGPKDIYYTTSHEWIDFQGAVAFTGICAFKLTGFKQVEQIRFGEPRGFKSKGEIIATIHYGDYSIEACMPVDGKIIQLNEALASGNSSLLLQHPETSGWIAKIAPSQPYERKGLMLPRDYQMNGKHKHAKS